MRFKVAISAPHGGSKAMLVTVEIDGKQVAQQRYDLTDGKARYFEVEGGEASITEVTTKVTDVMAWMVPA